MIGVEPEEKGCTARERASNQSWEQRRNEARRQYRSNPSPYCHRKTL